MIIGGLSMGGMVAMRFALKYHHMVRALILCDTAAGLSSSAIAAWTTMSESVEAFVRNSGVAAVIKRFWESQRTAGNGAEPPGVRRHIQNLERMSADGFLGAGKALREQESVLERLNEISVPTLILAGDGDAFLGPCHDIHERIAGSRFLLIRNSLHGTCLWQPQAFEKGVLDFLAAAEAGESVAGSFEL